MTGALYQTGKFGRTDSRYVWAILAGSTIGLLASTLGRLYASTYYALHDTRTPLRYAVLRVALGEMAEETILAIHSLSPAEQHISLDLRRWSGARVHDLLAARTLREVTPDPHPLALPPYGYLWLKLESSS